MVSNCNAPLWSATAAQRWATADRHGDNSCSAGVRGKPTVRQNCRPKVFVILDFHDRGVAKETALHRFIDGRARAAGGVVVVRLVQCHRLDVSLVVIGMLDFLAVPGERAAPVVRVGGWEHLRHVEVQNVTPCQLVDPFVISKKCFLLKVYLNEV